MEDLEKSQMLIKMADEVIRTKKLQKAADDYVKKYPDNLDVKLAKQIVDKVMPVQQPRKEWTFTEKLPEPDMRIQPDYEQSISEQMARIGFDKRWYMVILIGALLLLYSLWVF
jgi:hypothetical protein